MNFGAIWTNPSLVCLPHASMSRKPAFPMMGSPGVASGGKPCATPLIARLMIPCPTAATVFPLYSSCSHARNSLARFANASKDSALSGRCFQSMSASRRPVASPQSISRNSGVTRGCSPKAWPTTPAVSMARFRSLHTNASTPSPLRRSANISACFHPSADSVPGVRPCNSPARFSSVSPWRHRINFTIALFTRLMLKVTIDVGEGIGEDGFGVVASDVEVFRAEVVEVGDAEKLGAEGV